MRTRRSAGARRARPIDMRSLAEALSTPGIDPRQWVSYGVVDASDPVEFDPDYGPLIAVTLKPSEIEVVCRVAMQIAGQGEGEYHPFVAGDEVLVAIPGGNERADCAIFGRMSNTRTKFPSGPVAGQDPTTNTFGFRRARTPHLEEYAGPYMVQQATSGAFLSIDTKGAITLRDGQKAALQMSPDVFGYQSGDAKALLQLDLTGGRFSLQIEDALLTLSSSRASPETSALAVPGTLAVSTSANPAAEHVATTESVVNLIANILNALGAQLVLIGATPLTGASLGALLVRPAQDSTFMPLGIAAAATPGPTTGTLAAQVAAALFAAFAAATQKPAAVPGQGQLQPGLGSPGFLTG